MGESNENLAAEILGTSSYSQAGKVRRMRRLFSRGTRRILIVPIDDSLIFGPADGLEEVQAKIRDILVDPPDAVLAFPGVFRNEPHLLAQTAGIVNVTGSTGRSVHTRKVLIGSVHQSAQLGLDAVAVHVNISSQYEAEMLGIFGSVSRECESYGMPLVGIMYPRSESEKGDNNYDDLRANDRKAYAALVAHSARVAVDLGADLIKTKYTGDPESFQMVVNACKPVPIVVAGGPLLPISSALQMAYEVVQAGGAGVSFGRNVFSRQSSQPIVSALKAIVHDGLTDQQAQTLLQNEDKL